MGADGDEKLDGVIMSALIAGRDNPVLVMKLMQANLPLLSKEVDLYKGAKVKMG